MRLPNWAQQIDPRSHAPWAAHHAAAVVMGYLSRTAPLGDTGADGAATTVVGRSLRHHGCGDSMRSLRRNVEGTGHEVVILRALVAPRGPALRRAGWSDERAGVWEQGHLCLGGCHGTEMPWNRALAVWSAWSGQVFGWALVAVGAFLVLARREYSWLWFALVGWFLIGAATTES